MNTKSQMRARLIAAGLVAAAVAGVGSLTRADTFGPKSPLTADNFTLAAPRGFGDRDNSWAQSMVWWHDHLYVGTSRTSECTAIFSIWRYMVSWFGLDLTTTYFPYPPRDPDLSCPPNGADLRLQAEIWRWTPEGDSWQRVFQSPLDLDNPGPPPEPGKKLPYELTIRGMAPHTDPDGTEALYAFGVNTAVMWDDTKLPPPRVLRTTDGLNFTPVPQTPGTFLGDLPFNSDHSSFRSPVSFGGKLFVLSGPIFGQGTLIGSADPAKGDNAWFEAGPPNVLFYEMAAFNGWLYGGTFTNVFGAGYSVMKTRALGTPPYQFVTVVPAGAYQPTASAASKSVVSMSVYQGRLYVGTAENTEVIRINPDDTWDVVVGPARVAPTPDGGVELKAPLSGLDNGFGLSLNDHAWQMADLYGCFYIGTYNASTGVKDDPVNGPKLAHAMGAQLYRTCDGWYYSAVTTTGFAQPSDPFGGRFDYGIRTIANTPYGTFFGTANDYYGLAIFRAKPEESGAPHPPHRLEIEPTLSGGVVLSWTGEYGDQYQVWRAERLPIYVRAEFNVENWYWGPTGNLIKDTYIAPYALIAVTGGPFYVDNTVQAGKSYMYYVQAVHQGQLSDQSNLVGFPLLTPPMTFIQLLWEVGHWDQRQRFRSVSLRDQLIWQILVAWIQAARCQIGPAIATLNPQTPSDYLLDPEAIDLEVMTSKLTRRLTLYQQAPQNVITTEFCTSS